MTYDPPPTPPALLKKKCEHMAQTFVKNYELYNNDGDRVVRYTGQVLMFFHFFQKSNLRQLQIMLLHLYCIMLSLIVSTCTFQKKKKEQELPFQYNALVKSSNVYLIKQLKGCVYW